MGRTNQSLPGFTARIESTRFSRNSCFNAGALAIRGMEPSDGPVACSGGSASTNLLLENCTFESNTALGNGGAVFLSPSCSSTSIRGSFFLGNEAGLSGGAFCSRSTGTLEAFGSRFIGNVAGSQCKSPSCSPNYQCGGAILTSTSINILDSEFSDNVNLISRGGAGEDPPLHVRCLLFWLQLSLAACYMLDCSVFWKAERGT